MSVLHITSSKGFTAVELLVTLLVAGLFVFTGINLYTTIATADTAAHSRTRADRLATEVIERFSYGVQVSCAPSNPLTRYPIPEDPNTFGLERPLATVTITCPLVSVPGVSKLSVRIDYSVEGKPGVAEQEAYVSAP